MKKELFYYDFYFSDRFMKRFCSYKSALKFATSGNKFWTVKKVKKRKLSTARNIRKLKEFQKCQD